MINQQLDSASQKDILNEVNNMFDNMGIVQHHDAVTGTAR